MKVNKPKAHKQASHCVKWIPVVILLNYSAQLQQDPTIPLPCMVFSSNAKILLILTFKFPTLAPWTWGDGDTVRYHPEMRAGTDWLSTDSLDVTLACDDQPRCLSCGEGLSLVFYGLERRWDAEGHYQFLAIVHTGVKPHFGFPHLKIHWTSPRQGWCPAQQPWECSRRWRGWFLVDLASVIKIQNLHTNIQNLPLSVLFNFSNFHFLLLSLLIVILV